MLIIEVDINNRSKNKQTKQIQITASPDLLGEEDAVDLLLVHEKAVLVSGLSASAPLLHPAEQQDETKGLLVGGLTDVINLLHLQPLDAKILQQEGKEA